MIFMADKKLIIDEVKQAQPQDVKKLTHEDKIRMIRASHRKTQEKAKRLTERILYNDKG